MVRALFGLGSNLGERWRLLSTAVTQLRGLDDTLTVSSVYETAPVGGPDGQGAFLNCVVALHTDLAPMELLHLCHRLEQDAHRVRAERWGPRTLDVDVLFIDGYTADDPLLTVPHPRMHQRSFVLAPLEEVAPDLVGPDWRHRPGLTEGEIRCVGALLSGAREP